MGNANVCMGACMRMGCNPRFKFSLIFLILFTFSNVVCVTYSYANPVIAAGILGRIIARTLLNRAVLTTAARVPVLRATYSSLLRVSARAVLRIPTSSSLRLGSTPTWAGVAAAIAGQKVSDLVSTDDTFEEITDAHLNDDGTYTVKIERNGVSKSINIDFEPTELNPLFVVVRSVTQGSPEPVGDTETGPSVPNNAQYYYGYESPFYYGSDPVAVAQTYLEQSLSDAYQPRYEHFQDTIVDTVVDGKGNISYNSRDVDLTYIKTEYLFDIQHSAENVPRAGVLDEVFSVKMTTRSLNYDFEPCFTTVHANKSTTTVCDVPKKDDYDIETDTDLRTVKIYENSNYKIANIDLSYGGIDELEGFDFFGSEKLNNDKVAALINALMQDAVSEEDYEGIPFDRPFTAAEVAQAIQDIDADSTSSDWFTKAFDGDKLNIDIENEYNIYINNTTNNNNNNNNGGGNDYDDEDAEFEPPELEKVPTGAEILSLFDEAFPFLRDFKLTEKSAKCPIAEFSAFDKDYKIESHCTLLEENRALFSAIMLVVWSFVSLRIVLRA